MSGTVAGTGALLPPPLAFAVGAGGISTVDFVWSEFEYNFRACTDHNGRRRDSKAMESQPDNPRTRQG